MQSADTLLADCTSIIASMPMPTLIPCEFRVAVTKHCARGALLLAALALLPTARAESLYDDDFQHRHALGAKVGTVGPGLEYTYSYTEFPQFGFRANLNYGTYSRRKTEGNIGYYGRAEFNSLMLLADAHPFRNGFRITAGVMFNDNRVVASGTPVGDPVRFRNVDYPAAGVDNVRGEVSVQPVAPYFGFGWGVAPSVRGKIYWSFDLGVMYQRPDVTLDTTCRAPANCAQLVADLRAEERELRADLIKYGRMYPILTFGVGYRF